MVLAPGTRLGPYEIVSALGAGGMGQVWKARDTRLDRTVAIKTSGAEFTDRFAREARAIAALNHPHICALHDVGPDYLVMEYVEGQQLKGPLPLDQVLTLAIQLAGALDVAHRKGITHRDLKPANILMTKSGIKVLDFGLAKIERPSDAVAADDTVAPLTQEGAILGTLPYMAPEQVQGHATDARADIFSFGCVIYEMLTGTRAFSGANNALLIAAILDHEPPPAPEVTPPAFEWALRRCLAKDPDERWQTARDLRAALERVSRSASEATPAEKPGHATHLWAAAAVVATLAAVAVSAIHFREQLPATPVTRLSFTPPDGYTLTFFRAPPAVSPDGSQVVFAAVSDDGKSQLWLRPLESLTAQPLADTADAIFPFWSPDNTAIGFFAAGKLKRMNVSGGPATALADAPQGRGGTWSPGGVIVFAPTVYGGLYQVAASGGIVTPAVPLDPGSPSRKWPSFLPDGLHFLYLSGAGGRDQQTIRIGSLASPEEGRVLVANADSSAIFAQGHLLFVRGTTLVARPFDTERLELNGEEVPVAERLENTGAAQSWVFSLSANGVLVYVSAGPNDRQMTWMNRAGRRLGTVGDSGSLGTARLSPDARSVAVSVGVASGGNSDLWLYDILRGLPTRFTFTPGFQGFPVWSPDGRVLVFHSNRSGRFDLYRKLADGSRNEELLHADNLLKWPTGFSADAEYLAYSASGDPKTGADIWIMPDPLGTPGVAKPYPFMQTGFDEESAHFSPDGHWIAYQSNESNRREVYVAPFPGPGGKRQVSTAGGSEPGWRADGKELFYLAPDNRLMAATVDSRGGTFEVKTLEPLFGPIEGEYEASADGQRFLVAALQGGRADPPLTVVQNWSVALKPR